MALTFAYYANPKHAHAVAVATVVVITAVNYFGVKKTAAATQVFVVIALLTLTLIVGGSLWGGDIVFDRLDNWFEHGGISGILEAAGLMFFATFGLTPRGPDSK